MNAWKAFIPTSKEFPKLAPLIGRAIMVKGPSRSYWMSDIGMYNQQKGDCQITKNALEKTDTAIKANPSCQKSFYLIVFLKGIMLDNYIFSSNDNDLEMWKHGMKLGPNHARYPFKKKKMDVVGMCLWWRIGIAAGTPICNGEAKEYANDLFEKSNYADNLLD
jgi:hypothetical protein